MKRMFVLPLLFAAQQGFAQTNVYTFNNDKFATEAEIKTYLAAAGKSLPPDYQLTPVIYHKAVKRDTTFNYISFEATKAAGASNTVEWKPVYKQDSSFLLLNQALKTFTLKDIDGNKVSLQQFAGKPLLINFWAIYCGPCIAEMPQLSKVKDKYGDKMNFISITENEVEKDQLKKFLADKQFNFAVLENAQAYKDALKIKALPKNLFIDKNGVLRFIQGNYPVNEHGDLNMTDENNYFVKIIEQLISEK